MSSFPAPAVLLLLASIGGCASGGVQALESPAEQDSQAIAKPVTASDYSAHLDVLALGFKDGTFEVRSPAPRHVLGRGRHTAEVVNLALSRDGAKLATADALGKLALSAVES